MLPSNKCAVGARWLVALAFGSAGCVVDTAYVPKHPHRATFVMRQGQVELFVAGHRDPMTDFSASMGCDSDAKADALDAQKYIRSGQRNATISAAFIGLAVLFPALAFVGLPFAIIGSNDLHRGQAGAVDAVNRYNDSRACMAVAGAQP